MVPGRAGTRSQLMMASKRFAAWMPESHLLCQSCLQHVSFSFVKELMLLWEEEVQSGLGEYMVTVTYVLAVAWSTEGKREQALNKAKFVLLKEVVFSVVSKGQKTMVVSRNERH